MSYPVGYDSAVAGAIAKEQVAPIPVVVKNFSDTQEKEYIRNTTLQTFIIDPSNPTVNGFIAIAAKEPRRVRMEIQVIDQPVIVSTEAPSGLAPTSAATGPPISGGRYLPVSAIPYCFYGPDPMWIVGITANTAGRVGVLKEYR